MPPKKRNHESYVSFSFKAFNDINGGEKSQCFVCSKILCNDSMRPSSLMQHLKSMHPAHEYDTKDVMIQQRMLRFEASGTLKDFGFSAPKKPVLEAACKVAYTISGEKMPHTIGETLMKPCALDMVDIVCGNTQPTY